MIHFISINKFREEALVDTSVTEKLIRIHLARVQDCDLQELLGMNLYEDLQTKIANTSLSTYEDTLISKYISKFLISSVEQNILGEQMIQIRNSGVHKGTPDNVINASLEEIRIVYNAKEKMIARYASLITEYIKNNLDYFPKYNSDNNMIEPSKSKGNGFFYPIDYLDEIQNLKTRAGNKNEESI